MGRLAPDMRRCRHPAVNRLQKLSRSAALRQVHMQRPMAIHPDSFIVVLLVISVQELAHFGHKIDYVRFRFDCLRQVSA
jgi:hypothetical protein